MRGLGILAVIGYHMFPTWVAGNSAVMDIFFCLSGYLITGILWRELLACGRISLPAFYFRRAVRLFPALVIALGVIMPLTALAIGEGTQIIPSTVMVVLYAYNLTASKLFGALPPLTDTYAHTWSLSVEEQFYLVWPAALLALHRFVRPRYRVRVLCLCLGGSLVVWVLSNVLLGRWATYFLPGGHLAPFFLGAILALLELGGRIGRVHDRRLRIAGAGSALVIAAISLSPIEPTHLLTRFGLYLLWNAVSVLLICSASRPGLRDPLSRLLANPALVWMGCRSYALYLFHFPLAHLAPHYSWPIIPAQLSVLAVAILLADLSYRFVEAPIMAWGRSQQRRRTADSSLPAAPVEPVHSPAEPKSATAASSY